MDKELPKVPDRFTPKAQKLGQGTFSYIYEAYDAKLMMNVALKMEKKDKSKNILKFEYQVLQHLKGLQHVPNSYEYVQNSEQNFIVMDLLGINLAKARRCLEQRYDLKIAIQILIEMVIAVKEVHKRGFIHRDVKASNFVLDRENRQVYIVDFGLAKKHLDSDNQPVTKRKTADFRGTVSFASLNAHNNIDLSRRDDMWSLYFTMLDFLNEKLEWREQRDYTIVQVKDIKTKCLKNPKRKLWIGPTRGVKEVADILGHINSLHYPDIPNYQVVINQLLLIYNNYDMVQRPNVQGGFAWELKLRSKPHCNDLQRLEAQMKMSRTFDFQEYFNTHRTGSSQLRIKSDLRLFEPQPQVDPIFNIQANNPNGMPQQVLGQDPQRKIGQQLMQQMIPQGPNAQNHPYDNRGKLPAINQMREGNQMIFGGDQVAQGPNGHHQMYPKQQDHNNVDWMANFLPNTVGSSHLMKQQQHMLGNPGGQQPQDQNPNNGMYAGGNQGNGGANTTGNANGNNMNQNPQQQMANAQQSCNVQQFINIQFSQQQQQQQKQAQFMNNQHQVNAYNQQLAAKQGLTPQQQQQMGNFNNGKMGGPTANSNNQQQSNPSQLQTNTGKPTNQLNNNQPQQQNQTPGQQAQQTAGNNNGGGPLFQQSNGSGNGLANNAGSDNFNNMPRQGGPQQQAGYGPMNNNEELRVPCNKNIQFTDSIQNKRFLKRQSKGLGDIHCTGVGAQKNNVAGGMKRTKFGDIQGQQQQSTATGQQMQGQQYPQQMGQMTGPQNQYGGGMSGGPKSPAMHPAQQEMANIHSQNQMFDNGMNNGQQQMQPMNRNPQQANQMGASHQNPMMGHPQQANNNAMRQQQQQPHGIMPQTNEVGYTGNQQQQPGASAGNKMGSGGMMGQPASGNMGQGQSGMRQPQHLLPDMVQNDMQNKQGVSMTPLMGQGGAAGVPMSNDMILKFNSNAPGGHDLYNMHGTGNQANNSGNGGNQGHYGMLPLINLNQQDLMHPGQMRGGPGSNSKLQRRGGVQGKNHQAPPDGFYCYYPEVFEKPKSQIFIVTKYARSQLAQHQQPQE